MDISIEQESIKYPVPAMNSKHQHSFQHSHFDLGTLETLQCISQTETMEHSQPSSPDGLPVLFHYPSPGEWTSDIPSRGGSSGNHNTSQNSEPSGNSSQLPHQHDHVGSRSRQSTSQYDHPGNLETGHCCDLDAIEALESLVGLVRFLLQARRSERTRQHVKNSPDQGPSGPSVGVASSNRQSPVQVELPSEGPSAGRCREIHPPHAFSGCRSTTAQHGSSNGEGTNGNRVSGRRVFSSNSTVNRSNTNRPGVAEARSFNINLEDIRGQLEHAEQTRSSNPTRVGGEGGIPVHFHYLDEFGVWQCETGYCYLACVRVGGAGGIPVHFHYMNADGVWICGIGFCRPSDLGVFRVRGEGDALVHFHYINQNGDLVCATQWCNPEIL